MTGYENLDVWRESMALVTKIYNLLQSFPNDERFALSDQIRRSAVSIPSNIAEGSTRNSRKEFIQFLYIALGSVCELETQLMIARNVGYIKELTSILDHTTRIKKMLNGLISSLKRSL